MVGRHVAVACDDHGFVGTQTDERYGVERARLHVTETDCFGQVVVVRHPMVVDPLRPDELTESAEWESLAVTGCTCVRNGAHPCVYDLFPLARAPKATAVLEVARAEVLI